MDTSSRSPPRRLRPADDHSALSVHRRPLEFLGKVYHDYHTTLCLCGPAYAPPPPCWGPFSISNLSSYAVTKRRVMALETASRAMKTPHYDSISTLDPAVLRARKEDSSSMDVLMVHSFAFRSGFDGTVFPSFFDLRIQEFFRSKSRTLNYVRLCIYTGLPCQL